MKKTLAVLTMVLIVLMCACTPQTDDGFKSTTEVLSGGTDAENVNLNDIEITTEEGVTTLAFEFFQTDDAATQGTEMNALPSYTVSFCEKPDRMVLTVKNLNYWSYNAEKLSGGLVLGSFIVPGNTDNIYTSIYFNIAEPVSFKTEEAGGKLLVHMKPVGEQPSQCWYITGNLYYEYRDGVMPEDVDFTPTLTDDKSAVVMISRAFYSQEDANTCKAQLEEEYPLIFETKPLTVIFGNTRTLPGYSDSADVQGLNSKILLERNGIKENANVLFPDARLLCISNKGDKAIYAKKENADEYDSEKLYMVTSDSRKLIMEDDVTALTWVMFSPDDSKIFFIESIEGSMLCSLFDLQTEKQTPLDQELLGTFITGACFSTDGKAVFVMSGEETAEVVRYDIAAGTVSNIIQTAVTESELRCGGGRLFFMDVIDEVEVAVSCAEDGSDKQNMGASESFTISKDGKKLLTQYSQVGTDGKSVLKLTEDGKTVTVAEDTELGEYFFSADQTKVFYTVNSDNTEFPVSLVEYDIASARSEIMFSSIEGDYALAMESDKLSFTINYGKDGVDYPAAYTVRIK